MRIACLGWGSLIWDLNGLPIAGESDGWYSDGPYLPVEFARQSSRNRLTLVLLPEGKPVQTLWAEMIPTELAIAREALRCREGASNRNAIGVWPTRDVYLHSEAIGAWAQSKSFDAVVWTALTPKFDGEEATPTEDQVLNYLRVLKRNGSAGEAEIYVRRAPAQVRTPYRDAIERELGWAPRRY